MLKILLATVVVLIAAVLLFAATRPGTFRVERHIAIKAPAARVYALIDDFRQWQAWSPYERRDPSMQRTYSGAASGIGAIYAWNGSAKVGEGRMEITRAALPSQVVIQLDFVRPFEGHNIAAFTLQPEGGTVDVRWTMEGPSPYMARLMGIFFNMDKMIGKDFEEGLARLKETAEHPPGPGFPLDRSS